MGNLHLWPRDISSHGIIDIFKKCILKSQIHLSTLLSEVLKILNVLVYFFNSQTLKVRIKPNNISSCMTILVHLIYSHVETESRLCLFPQLLIS